MTGHRLRRIVTVVTTEEAEQLRSLAAARNVSVAALVRARLRTPPGNVRSVIADWHIKPPDFPVLPLTREEAFK